MTHNKLINKQVKSIIYGILLILFAVALILNAAGVFEGFHFTISPVQIIVTLICICCLVNSIQTLSFVGITLSISVALVMYRNELQIPASLSSWLLVFASFLIGCGFDWIFRGPKKKMKHRKHNHFEFTYNSDDDHKQKKDDDSVVDSSFVDERRIHLSNSFGESIRYIKSQSFEHGEFENGFGNLVVYFENVQFAGPAASLSLDNGFGSMSLYLPKTWRLSLSDDSGFGSVEIHGTPSTDNDAPLLMIQADNGFGHIDIYCE